MGQIYYWETFVEIVPVSPAPASFADGGIEHLTQFIATGSYCTVHVGFTYVLRSLIFDYCCGVNRFKLQILTT